MPFSQRIKSLFSRRSSSQSSSRTSSPPGTPSCEEPSCQHKRQRSGSVSSAYAAEIAYFSDNDWMLHASPTATLTESDTAPPTPPQAQPKKKRRPTSMFASWYPQGQQGSADPVRVAWEPYRNRRRSVSAVPFTFIVPGVTGRRAYSMPSMTPFF